MMIRRLTLIASCHIYADIAADEMPWHDGHIDAGHAADAAISHYYAITPYDDC